MLVMSHMLADFRGEIDSHLHIGQPHFGQANLHTDHLTGTGVNNLSSSKMLESPSFGTAPISCHQLALFVVTCHLRVCSSQGRQELSQPKTGIEIQSYNDGCV